MTVVAPVSVCHHVTGMWVSHVCVIFVCLQVSLGMSLAQNVSLSNHLIMLIAIAARCDQASAIPSQPQVCLVLLHGP